MDRKEGQTSPFSHRHVLLIPEIILEVVKHTHTWKGYGPIDFTDIDSAGLVCKAWRGPSLVAKWHKCRLTCLLSMLVPLERTGNGWVSVDIFILLNQTLNLSKTHLEGNQKGTNPR